jgi:hypothetical protein
MNNILVGVIGLNSLSSEWISDILVGCDDNKIIDLNIEEFLNEHQYLDVEEWPDIESDIILINYKNIGKDGKILYDIDRSKRFCAIISLFDNVAQITYSQCTKTCRLCSPCYPNQGNLDEKDEMGFLCYDLPEEYYEV